MRENLNAEQWASFVRETDAHLDNVRQILISTQGGCIGAERLECLARSFQSIQWLSSSMGALAMEMLASCAEAFLAEADEDVSALQAALATQLLSAVDDLKMLRDNEAGEHCAVPSARLQGVVDDPIWQMPEDEYRIGPFLHSYAGGEASNDAADFIGFFVELIRDNIPALTVLTSPACESGENCSACSGCAKMAISVESIRHAAEAMGYARIKSAFDEIRAHIPESGRPATRAQRTRIIEKLPAVLALIDLECR